MSKPRRGSNAKKTPGWRGTCPVCSKKRVKVLWSAIKDGQTVKACKKCGNQ